MVMFLGFNMYDPSTPPPLFLCPYTYRTPTDMISNFFGTHTFERYRLGI